MAVLSVGANRMNLLALQRKLAIAQRGHKLLKEKQDELMRNFLGIIEQIRGLRARMENMLINAMRRFTIATGPLSRSELDAAFVVPPINASLEVRTLRLLSLNVPNFFATFAGEGISYSIMNTPIELDAVMKDMTEALKLLILLAETEKKLQLLAYEIDSTRRRVNALEYILIPNLSETMKYIKMKLEELERGNLTRLMKVKNDIIAAKYAAQ